MIKRKELQVSNLIHNHAIDILVVTETWLTSNDDTWKKATDLNKNNLQLYTMDRGPGKGGGIALICKRSLQVHHIPYPKHQTFEHSTWKIKSGNTSITIHGIYHPPYSLRNKCTNNMFLDDFTNYLTNTLPDPDLLNHIMLGDFNLHISEDPNEIEPATFIDTIEAVGLYHHVGFNTQ